MEIAHQENLLRDMAARLRVSIHIEQFCRKGDQRDNHFELMEGTDVESTTDDGLPNQSIHLLRLAESYRLRINIEDEPDMPLAVEDIESVTVQMPDAPPINLETVVTAHNVHRQEVVALIDPCKSESPSLQRISPSFGGVQRQYAKMEVKIHLRHRDNASWGFDLKRSVYCKMVHQHSHLLYHKIIQKAKEQWEGAPQWIKRGVQLCHFWTHCDHPSGDEAA